jgi:PAS domain S-box-containing protein
MSKPLRLLIVEDDVIDRKLLERLLAHSTLEIAEVRSADRLASALQVMQESPFDVILLDLGLPDSQGVGCITQLQALAPYVPIIVLTGLDDETIATSAVQQGVQDYLVKGQVDSSLLVRAIRYALERKRAERELQAAELRYRTIFENSAVAIMMVDHEERLVSWNKFTERLLAVSPEELQGRLVSSFYPDAEWDRIRKLSVREKGMLQNLETKMLRKDGVIIDVDVSLSVLRDADGGIMGSIGVVSDITERRRLHEFLDRKQKNLEAIFDAAPLGMLLVNEQGLVVRANDAVRQMFGRGYGEIVNRHPCRALACVHAATTSPSPEGCPPCDKCLLQKLLETTLKAGTPVRGVETRLVLNRDGGKVEPWFSFSLEPVNVDGCPHVVMALNDITERKSAEEQLQETMELKSQFISTVSHELRTPLTAMREAVIIVADGVAGKLSKDQKHFLDIARRNIERLGRLIDDVLDFQKLSAGKMEFHMQSGHMEQTIDEAYNTMRPHAQQKGLHLSVELEPNLPALLYDSDRMIQVLTNLLSNAIKFTPEGGRVSVSARRQAEHLAVRVSDTGMGIPKEALPRMFSRFYRVHRPGKEIKGTGLGLAIVEKIVTGHGGRIELESEVDKGTTFTVLLPLEGKPSAGSLPAQEDEHLEKTLIHNARS